MCEVWNNEWSRGRALGKLIKVLAFLPVSGLMRGKCYKLLKIGNGRYGENFSIGFGSYIDAKNIIIGEDRKSVV